MKCTPLFATALALFVAVPSSRSADHPSSAAYASIQAAIDANPGRMVFVPPGDHQLTQAIVIAQNGGGLYGPGRLIQSNTNSAHIEIRGAAHVRLRDLTLMRPEGKEDARASAILAEHGTNLVFEGLRILENRAASAALRLVHCQQSEIVRCTIQNYMTIAIDDRTRSPDWGYAFQCIDGTGISASSCQGLLIQASRIIEHRIKPTPEIKERYQLGKFVQRAEAKGSIISQKTWDEEYVNNWHQGSGIAVTSPESSAFIRILDNHIENGAQGIDIHADHVIVTGNMVLNCFMGMKAMHGSRHVLIANNIFSRNDLWSIGLMPGAASHRASAAEGTALARTANSDGGSIIAQNIISEFGYGDSHWIWDPVRFTCAPILLDRGQKPENPPLSDVLITGNMVYDSGRDGVLIEGKPKVQPPRYRHAVFVHPGPGGPQKLHFNNNLLHAGSEGVSNVEFASGRNE